MRSHVSHERSTQKDLRQECPDTLRLYLSEIGSIPRLTHEEEQSLAVLAQSGDERAWHRMILANLRLVASIARQYETSAMPLLDAIQSGSFGLLKAIERFDPDRGVHFGTYATYWIRQAIIRELQNTARLIRLPGHVHERLRAMDRATEA
jgi:RNA polymerase primary sigma factor